MVMRTHSLSRSLHFALLIAASLPTGGATAPYQSWLTEWNASLAFQWQAEVVDNSPSVGTFVSLALDAEDQPYISYFDDATNGPKVAHPDGETWRFESLDSGNALACQTSLALDAVGRPLVSY